jgi:D-3-phosphoglycerate dehydrogenase / 2-oxoglutarate reductase
MKRVLIADKLEATGIELLAAAGIEVDNRPGLKGDELKTAIRAADAVICRSQPKLTAEYFEDTGKLRAVARAGVGVDNIDVAAATRKGVVVMNTPSGNTVSAAEHTIALLLALARRIPAADAVMKAGGWDRNKFVGTEVAGKTLGVIGLGRIGGEVARRAKGMDMRIIALDPMVTPARATELGYEMAANLDDLLPRVDFLTVHVPGGDKTKSLIGARELGLMKKNARVLNVARGGVVDEKALADALAAGTIAGAGVDVFTAEPVVADNPLLKAPNVVLTPHLGASTLEAQENVAVEAAQLIVDFLQKGQIANAVNMAAVNLAELAEVRPYVDLARRLGLLQAQLAQSPVRKASLSYRGELAGQKTKLLTAAFTAGLLEYHLSAGVNLVNAELLARERGIEIVESSSSKKGDFAALLSTEVETEQGPQVAAGTLFGDQYVRLVQLGPYRMEGYLDGVLLVFTHRDTPGLIGFIGTIFGKHAVNIAQMTVGRQTPGGEAIAILNLDSPPPAEALAEVKGHPQISSLSVVKLPAAGELPTWLG